MVDHPFERRSTDLPCDVLDDCREPIHALQSQVVLRLITITKCLLLQRGATSLPYSIGLLYLRLESSYTFDVTVRGVHTAPLPHHYGLAQNFT